VKPAPWIVRGIAACLLAALCQAAVSAQSSASPQLGQATQALQAGEADKALSLINSLPNGGAQLAEAQNIRCRVHYALQMWDDAQKDCENAVQLDGNNSDYHLWLGRALGEKASRASFLSAYSLAKRVKSEFQTATQLNPRNADALASLGDFDQQAPGAVGGGVDKAEAVAAQLDKVDAALAHELRAHIAEGKKDYATAEQEFKQAVAVATHPAKQWTSIAGFYRRRSRWDDMENAVHSCITAEARDKSSSVALFDGAGVLTEANRDPALAAKMLSDYLASSSKTEDAPAFEAHVRLATLKKQSGDAASAQREKAAALALAHDYKPALNLKF
jgi:tetratricopeptide (TPR) repeat protein